MEGDVIDVRLVAGELRDELAVGRVPELDEVVVAAGGDLLAIGTDGQGAEPALMGIDRRGSARGFSAAAGHQTSRPS